MSQYVPKYRELPSLPTEVKHPISVPQAARELQLRYPVVMRLVRRGKLRGAKIGKRFYVERDDLARCLKEAPWSPWCKRESGK